MSLMEPARKKRKSRFGAPVATATTPATSNADKDAARAKALSIAQKLSSTVAGLGLGMGGAGGTFQAKIPVPVDQEPGFNFIGMIIGYKGMTCKQLQQETGCKIMFKGRNSSKDGNDMDPDRPLYVHLVAMDQAAIERGTARIKELLYDKQKRWELRRNQMGGDGPGWQPHGDFGQASEVGECRDIVNVPSDKVGVIIGKGGAKIRELQEVSRCRMDVARESDPQTPNLRAVTIRGSREDVEKAKAMVMETIQQVDNWNNGGRPNGSVEKVIHIPTGQVGLLIGKGGETIRSLQERTQCSIHVERDKEVPDPHCQTRRVFLNGIPQNIGFAEQEIWRMLGEHAARQHQWNGYQAMAAYGQQMANWGTHTAATNSALMIAVPEEKIPKLIENNGEHIKRIERQTGCRVLVPTSPNQGVRHVRIEGSRRDEAKARVDDVLGMVIPPLDQPAAAPAPGAPQGYPPAAPWAPPAAGYPPAQGWAAPPGVKPGGYNPYQAGPGQYNPAAAGGAPAAPGAYNPAAAGGAPGQQPPAAAGAPPNNNGVPAPAGNGAQAGAPNAGGAPGQPGAPAAQPGGYPPAGAAPSTAGQYPPPAAYPPAAYPGYPQAYAYAMPPVAPASK